MVVTRVVLLASLALAACDVGEVPANGGGSGSGSGDTDAGPSVDLAAGEASFSAMIVPLVTECATAACHGGVQPPILTNFAALTTNGSNLRYVMKPGPMNIMVTKGNLTAGQHSGLPYFTAAEQTTVGAWIDSIQ